ncbi:MAG TPA: hypothetical protein VGD37_07915 [Kofleriaceae bacterium]|jgi:hypothetical protein
MRAHPALVVAAGLAAGCPGAPSRPAPAASDSATRDDETRLTRQYNELQDDIFTSYDRDEPPELGTRMIDARIGAARIGAGPSDVHLGDLSHAPSRWPLDVGRSIRTEVRSKSLELHIALDQTAGWMADEVSWRIDICGRSAVIPLRITALYAQDGDRWVPVVEHLSFGASAVQGAPPLSAPIKAGVVSAALRDQLLDVVTRALLRTPHDPGAIAGQSQGGLVLGPDAADEWHGARVLDARLPPGKFGDPRIGVIGRTPATATVAYWIGPYAVAGAPAGAALRATHVFEKRWFDTPGGLPSATRSCHLEDKDARTGRAAEVAAHCRWMLVQSHLSQPIGDDELAGLVFGSARLSSSPLKLVCDERPRATAPAAGPRPAATPPTAGSR